MHGSNLNGLKLIDNSWIKDKENQVHSLKNWNIWQVVRGFFGYLYRYVVDSLSKNFVISSVKIFNSLSSPYIQKFLFMPTIIQHHISGEIMQRLLPDVLHFKMFPWRLWSLNSNFVQWQEIIKYGYVIPTRNFLVLDSFEAMIEVSFHVNSDI